ncbi:MAG: hypothetical protein ACO3A4_08510 [Silvanigrellaceae bacterium]
MKIITPLALTIPMLVAFGCINRNYNTLSSKEVTEKGDQATVVVESTSVRQLVRVIGIEKDEAHCLGGNPKHVVFVKPSEKIVMEVPLTVTQIGLCGQATPTGMDYKLVPVKLKKDQKLVIKNDVAVAPIAPGFARVLVKSTSVAKLARVIGIEKDEAACVGGNPKFITNETGSLPIEIDFPVSVQKVGLCGQATPTGMDYKHIPVVLKEGQTLTIENDKVN